MFGKFVRGGLFATLLCATAGLEAAPFNLTGTWLPKYWTVRMALHQEGDRVWGSGGDFWFRGSWDGKRLLLVANQLDEPRKTCRPRGTFVVTGTTVNSVTTLWLQPGSAPIKGPWVRVSPDAGEPPAYPYAKELAYCGSLRTYELAFATGSDQLKDENPPILAAVADMLKGNASARIQVAGHTDSTGDAKGNQELSERRAAAVKRVLVERHGVEEARVTVRGWGAEQPLEDNKTEEGRALNRRVEIVLSR